MTDKQPEAPKCTAADGTTEIFNVPGRPLLVRAADFNRLHAENETLRAKLKVYEDLGGAADDVQLLRMGYAAARLEIESLKAQLAERAKEHADELTVAYMCGASREKELTAQQPGAAYAALIHDLEVIVSTTLHATIEGSRKSHERDTVRKAIEVIRASHGQAPAGAAEPTEQQILEAAFAPAQPAQTGEARPVTPYTCPKCHALWLHWPAEQIGIDKDTLNCRSPDHCHYCETAGVEQLKRLERIPAALHAPQPSSTAQADSVLEDAARRTTGQEHAIRQGHEIAASDGYFEARPQIDSNDRRKVFQAGFERGWDAARKQGGAT